MKNDCMMRNKDGVCLPSGGDCASVDQEKCTGYFSAFQMGEREGIIKLLESGSVVALMTYKKDGKE